MSARKITHYWHDAWLRVLALLGISLAGMSVRADDYEDWLGIG
jgi:hypothetical protein